MFMEMARVASRRSTCFRLNVGAIVTRGNNIVAVGYNGHEPGAPHCSGNDCPGVMPGLCGTRHAEVNALEKAKVLMLGKSRKPVDLYCTDSLCNSCVGYIIKQYVEKNTGIIVGRIFYETPYRDVSPLRKVEGLIEVYRITSAGYIMNHFSRKVIELP